MTNPYHDQNCYDELLDELRHTIRYQGEQLREAIKVVSKLRDKLKEYASEDECASCQGGGVYSKHAMDEVQAEIDLADQYLDQNSEANQ